MPAIARPRRRALFRSYDVKSSSAAGAQIFTNLMQSAEHFAQMWEKCEALNRSRKQKTLKNPVTFRRIS
jgi:hypothetical protein